MKLYVLLNIILCFSGLVFSQEVSDEYSIEIGPKSLTIGEPLTISVILRDVENRVPVVFPQITGLEKQSKSATSAINTIDGKKVVVQTVSQQYFAKQAGRYEIPSFTISVNGVRVRSEETVVVFGLGQQSEAVVEAQGGGELLPELEENNRDIFLSVQSDKNSVYLREGFALRVSLFVAENAPVEMEFYEFNTQLRAILKKLRPIACWEENVGIEEIVKRQIRIAGRNYTEYNMYQAQLFPLTLQDILLPAVKLEMLVVDSKRNGNFNTKVIRAFTSRVVKIAVKPLPPHPTRDQVAVGQYNLVERLSTSVVYPGQSTRYLFKIEGKGNIDVIAAPEVPINSVFDLYPPDISQVIRRSDRNVTGEKAFDYFVVPRQDGKFPLGRYFQWVYFDPVTARYDTLVATKTLAVQGEDYRLGNISLNGSLHLYDNIEKLDSSRESIDFKKVLRNITNGVVLLLLIAMIWVYRK
jgi:hypothetical protein